MVAQVEECLKIAEQRQVYYTRRGSTLYAIHWGWPDGRFVLEGVRPRRNARIRILGGSGDLTWRTEGDRVVVDAPSAKAAGKFAYALAIEGVGEN